MASIRSHRVFAAGENPRVMRYIGNGKIWDDELILRFIERQQKLQRELGHYLWVMER